VIIKQTGKTKLWNRNFGRFPKRIHKAPVINIAAEQKIKEYSFGVVCALTKEELLRNRVPIQSRKKNRNTIYAYTFTP